ncbi:MAG: carboxypeptidase regulatory-like domain-containing protein [Candidatus Thermoplasmatota archaeon]|nr:carboxypeptidase regulatory-like domain-containing protein [Candidatus Thermoplasmatota archaeon]
MVSKQYIILIGCIILLVVPTTSGHRVLNAESTALQTSSPFLPNASLSGYVTDPRQQPIADALVRVYYHETYQENYSDETGYYHVTNIPLCWCMKNATCSKEGYYPEWILLAIGENTTHDFVLTPQNITCYPVFNGTTGTQSWYRSNVSVSFYVNGMVDAIYYRLDDADWEEYLTAFSVTEEGSHTLHWYFIEQGNTSDEYQTPLNIDYSPPALELTTERISISTLKVIANVTDAVSGVNRVTFTLDGVHHYTDDTPPYEVYITGIGIHLVKATVYDHAGNHKSSTIITSYAQNHWFLQFTKDHQQAVIMTLRSFFHPFSR